MDLRHLRYFQAVAEELSFSKAAQRLRIAQPALSRAVQELEQDLGTRLIDRNRRTVSLTPAGTVLLGETSVVLERLDESLRRVKRTAAGEEGELRLGYIGPPTQPFLGRLLAEYRRRFPKVSVHLEERTPERVWEMVAKGRLSVALTRPVPGQGGKALSTLPLRQEPLGIVVRAEHPLAEKKSISWKALAQEPLIVLARREGVGLHDEILAACRAAGFAPRIAQSPSLMGTVLTYVEAGAGIGIATDSVAAASMPAGLRYVPVTPEHSVPLVMVWNPDELSPAVKAFRDLTGEWLKDAKLWPAD
jgi:LysR family transcriptional regulator, benzoate and cis,cis-muconate-responsive activator of ben and cat genes